MKKIPHHGAVDTPTCTDVLMVINADVNGYKDLIKSYTTECFPEGLSLEGEDEECCYLETIIRNTKWDIQCQHRNKNANMQHQEFYRGKHAWSFHEDKHKFGVPDVPYESDEEDDSDARQQSRRQRRGSPMYRLRAAPRRPAVRQRRTGASCRRTQRSACLRFEGSQ